MWEAGGSTGYTDRTDHTDPRSSDRPMSYTAATQSTRSVTTHHFTIVQDAIVYGREESKIQ